ncbi:MAG: hypothetical protein ACRDRI_16135 [Pseudonocardiaceae bacterium]
MTYLPPRTEDGTPLTYAEDRCALRWPLVLFGITLPILSIVVLTFGTITRARGPMTAYVSVLFVVIWVVTGACYLTLVWPLGMRIDADGIRIGGIRYAERHPDHKRRRKPPPPSYQCFHVFSCPWEAIRSLEFTTDHKTLRALRRTSTSAPTRGIQARAGRAIGFYLGMLTAPFMRAALVIHVDPEKAQFPAFRSHQALAVATSQIGTQSRIWVVPTRRPDELREIIRAVSLATPPGC